jgi:hypothetical protein
MKAGGTRRGWPLYSLAMVVGGWVLLRSVLWEVPFPQLALPLTESLLGEPVFAAPDPLPRSAPPVAAPDQGNPAAPVAPQWRPPPPPAPLVTPQLEPLPLAAARGGPVRRGGLLGADRIIAHAMLLQAGYRAAQPQAGSARFPQGVGPVAPGVVYAPEAARRFASEAGEQRWSLDFWALWRQDTTTPFTSGRPSYGRSQVGAVLAYRLDPGSGHAPQAYLRATRALGGQQESEVAAGLSARPLPGFPVRLAAEARVSETDRGTEVRGAAYAVSELPPVQLPAGFSGEAYVQAGYVSGEFATPFVDGQARITREVARSDNFRLTAGAGAWGGAQEDAGRLDVGPSAAVGFDLGRARGRLAADYRFRVAGEAEPSSGPAITLTAGF